MQYIEAIKETRVRYSPAIFLAGGITNCHDWQKEAKKYFVGYNVTVFNPRRKTFDINNPKESDYQRLWEYKRLRLSTSIIFWFPEETLCPITLFELGAALERKQVLTIGCHPNYARLGDVKHQAEMAGFQVPIFLSLPKMMQTVQAMLSPYKTK